MSSRLCNSPLTFHCSIVSILKVGMCCVSQMVKVPYFTEPLSGAVIRVLSFLERSRGSRRSFGAACAFPLGVVSIASCEASDRRSSERCARSVGFAFKDKAFGPTSLEVEGSSLSSEVPWLEEASGMAMFEEGRAALAAPTEGADGGTLGTLRVPSAAA